MRWVEIPKKLVSKTNNMHGLWYERTYGDLIREAIIHAVVTALYLPAYKAKCIPSIVIISVIFFQHLASLFIDPNGFLPNSFHFPGAIILALSGYIKNTNLLFFAGFYSAASKIEYINYLSKGIVEDKALRDSTNEILKLFIAVGGYFLIILLFPFQKFWRRYTGDSKWEYKPCWNSEMLGLHLLAVRVLWGLKNLLRKLKVFLGKKEKREDDADVELANLMKGDTHVITE